MQKNKITKAQTKTNKGQFYIKQSNSFPLNYKEVGHISPSLENFIGFKNSSYI